MRIPVRVGSRSGDPSFDWTNRSTWATGRDIRFQDVSIEEYSKTLEGFGLPPDYVQFISYLFTEVFDGRNASLTNGVQQVLNREPSDFSSFIQKNLPSGIWS